MPIYKARRVSFAYYLTAAISLFICLLLNINGLLMYLLYAIAALLAVQGYRIATKYSRCPKCGHVLQVGLFRLTQCSFCNYPITDQSVFTF